MAHIQNVWEDDYTTNKANRYQCCGCSACESVCGKKAISMKTDKEGFLYPLVDECKCVDCGQCTKVCPIVNRCEEDAPYLKTYAGYSTNERIINLSASGGVATALALSTLQKGGVVFGVKMNGDYAASEYCIARTKEENWAFSGSKYTQPNKTDILKQVKEELQKGIQVLFTGCPCDVAALHRFLNKNYDNLLTCELFCAGVTSDKVLEDYRKVREEKEGAKIKSFSFRTKDKGWFVGHIKEIYDNGKVYYKNFYGSYLGFAFLTFKRPSCCHCQYKQSVTYCDIKIGDFWGIKESDPYWNPKGVSVILTKNQKGIAAIESLDDFKLFEIEHKKATVNNAGFMGLPSAVLEKNRNLFEDWYINHDSGLVRACRKTANWGFWIKYYVPSSFHSFMKKVFHSIIDKK